ncbi:16215_t:CDS:1 [Acaulospora colombiana]|uniref:16215_t:CDS:1 n=1 Tax=Acaulospora colombiana TaxID=27376 RepID=A0ACA9KWQ6_9GLOM|nr:16215_t:CDS:1 [Acaulospora colombiana]
MQGKSSQPEVKPELPAFEWQVTGETELADCITKATATLTPPDDAILGTTDGRRKPLPKRSDTCRGRLSCNTESRRLRLMQIIEDENSRTRFRDYLVSQYCEENLDFYMDVCQYREFFCSTRIHANDDIREISSHAKYIWNFYLDSDTSSKPLNVPQDLANNCQQKIHSRQYTIDIFDKLQQHCFDLMAQDSLPKFTRNSMIPESYSTINLSLNLNHPTDSNHLKPLSLVGKVTSGPRKSLSSGSLRSKLVSTLASLKTTTNDLTSVNQTIPSTPPPRSPKSPAHSVTSTIITSENSEGNRSSMASTGSTNTTNSTISTSSTSSTLPTPTSDQGRRLSFSGITRRVLSRRRNSISLILGQFSLVTLNLHNSNSDKAMVMPGSYPLEDQEDCGECEGSPDNAAMWQKLRRNISTPNFQSRSNTTIRETCVAEKGLPPLPDACDVD